MSAVQQQRTGVLGKGCGGVGSYVSTRQKLCVHPQPDAHLSTQHTYTASHRGAPPPAGAAEEGGPTPGPFCTSPPAPRGRQPGVRRPAWGRSPASPAPRARPDSPGPAPARRLPREAQTPPPLSSPASSSQAAGASAGAGRRSIAPAPGAAAGPRRERQARARGAEQGSRGPEPAASRRGESGVRRAAAATLGRALRPRAPSPPPR